jgi:hypothetical protein
VSTVLKASIFFFALFLDTVCCLDHLSGLLLDFVHPAGLLDELDLIISLMVHSLLPDRGLVGASIRPPEDRYLGGVG